MKLYHYLLAIAIVVSMQFTDYKFFDLKIADLFSLLCCVLFLFIVKYIKLPVFFVRLLLVFFILFFNSLIVLLYVKLYPPSELSILKKPGILSLSRYIQYIGCIFFSFFIYYIFNTNTSNFNKKFYLFIDKLMILFSIFYLIVFFMSLIGIETPFIYSKHRIRGGYVEGGPFGLFTGFYLIIRYLMFKKIDIYSVLFIILIILSQSKAAIVFLASFYIIYLLLEKKLRISRVFSLILFLLGLTIIGNQYFNLSGKLLVYLEEYKDIEYQASIRGEDHNLIAGRIAALYISPNIIKDNPVLGIGMGNYSLVRNNPKYLGGLPRVLGWDLSGLGGVYNILIESGFLGLSLFLSPFIYLWRKVNNKMIRHGIILFFLAQIFGVQSYFQYIWFGLGLFYYLGIKNKSTILE